MKKEKAKMKKEKAKKRVHTLTCREEQALCSKFAALNLDGGSLAQVQDLSLAQAGLAQAGLDSITYTIQSSKVLCPNSQIASQVRVLAIGQDLMGVNASYECVGRQWQRSKVRSINTI